MDVYNASSTSGAGVPPSYALRSLFSCVKRREVALYRAWNYEAKQSSASLKGFLTVTKRILT